jgi:hypothetical protein
LDEALAAVGGHNRYQVAITALASCFALSFGCTFSALWLLITDHARICAETNAGERYEERDWLWNSPCEDIDVLWRFPGLYVSGGVIGLVLFACSEAIIGRRRALTVISAIGLVASLGGGIAPRIWLFQAFLPIKGLADICGLVISTLYVTELVDTQYRNWFLSVIALAVYLSCICTNLSWNVLSNYRLIMLISGLLYGFQVLFVRKLIESPRYQAAILGKYSQARSSLLSISSFNRMPAFNYMLEGEKVIGLQEEPEAPVNINSKSSTLDSPGKLVYLRITKDVVSVSQGDILHMKRFTYWDLVKLKPYRRLFFTNLLVWMSLLLLFATLSEQESYEKLRFRIFQWCADCLFLLLTAGHLNYTGRLGSSIVYLTAGSLSAVLYHGLRMFHSSASGLGSFLNVMEVVLIHAARLFAKGEIYILVVYSLEIVPTVLRFLAFSLFLSVSALLWLMILIFASNMSSILISASAIAVFFTCILSCFLPDTSQEDLPDYLPEDLEEMQKPTELSQIEVAAAGSPRAPTS